MANEATWIFAPEATREPTPATVKATQACIDRLMELAHECEVGSGMEVLEAAPGLYTEPVNHKAAMALTYEAAATWLWGQLHGEPDGRELLLEYMSN